METLESRNLFINSSSAVKGDGSQFEIYLPSHDFTIKDGQFMRLSVESILGAKNFTNVNSTNSKLTINLTEDRSGTDHFHSYTFNLTHTNHPNVKTLADYAPQQMVYAIQALDTAITSGDMSAISYTNQTVSENDQDVPTDKKLKGTLTNVPYSITSMNVRFTQETGGQMLGNYNDTHLLLGGRKNVDDGLVFVRDGANFSVQSYYPMQLATIHNVYLHTNLTNTNYANKAQEAAYITNLDTHATHSTVIGIATVHDEYYSYSDHTSTTSGYYINLVDRSVSQMKFWLSTHSGVASPVVGDQQNTNGNSSVEIVLRLDVCGYRQ